MADGTFDGPSQVTLLVLPVERAFIDECKCDLGFQQISTAWALVLWKRECRICTMLTVTSLLDC